MVAETNKQRGKKYPDLVSKSAKTTVGKYSRKVIGCIYYFFKLKEFLLKIYNKMQDYSFSEESQNLTRVTEDSLTSSLVLCFSFALLKIRY